MEQVKRDSTPIGFQSEALSLNEAATALGISTKHSYELIRDGRFPIRTVRVGRRIIVPRRAFEAFLAGDGGSNAPEAA